MRQVGDGAVPVLEVEGVEELLRLLVVDLLQRLAHRERRARILGHGVSLHLGLDTIDGEDVGTLVWTIARHRKQINLEFLFGEVIPQELDAGGLVTGHRLDIDQRFGKLEQFHALER